jgi:hypothetical protein
VRVLLRKAFCFFDQSSQRGCGIQLPLSYRGPFESNGTDHKTGPADHLNYTCTLLPAQAYCASSVVQPAGVPSESGQISDAVDYLINRALAHSEFKEELETAASKGSGGPPWRAVQSLRVGSIRGMTTTRFPLSHKARHCRSSEKAESMSAEIKIGSNVKIPALAALITVTMGLYIHAAWADTCVATNPNDARDELRNKPQGPGLLNTTACGDDGRFHLEGTIRAAKPLLWPARSGPTRGNSPSRTAKI